MRRFLFVFAIVCISPLAAFAADDWVGQRVFMRTEEVALRTKDKTEKIGTWNYYSARVLRVDSDWLEVRIDMAAKVSQGWVKKSEVVKAADAPAFYTDFIKQNKDSVWGYTNRSQAWHVLGEPLKELADLTTVIKLDPKESTNYENRGVAYLDQQEYDKAIQDFNEAIRLSPKRANAFVWRGIVWMDQKEYDKAMKDFDTAIKLDPDFATAFYHRGLTWAWKGNYEQAIKDYTAAIKLDPTDASFFLRRGDAWDETGEASKAIKDYSAAIKLDPTLAEAFVSRGRLLKEEGEYRNALADYAAAIKLTPEDADVCDSAAWIYATCPDPKIRNGKKAVELATKACELTKWKKGDHLDTLAAAYAETGNFAKAVEYEKEALADKEFADENGEAARERLKLYQKKRPYREMPVEK